jgi:hypothetical protein
MTAPFTHSQYRDLLATALGSGYQFSGFEQLRDSLPDAPACLLRHDCDNDLVAAAEMASIEAAIGVRSTYFLMLRSALYNLLSLPNLELAGQIVSQGHWIGLHFDERRLPGATGPELAAAADRERAILEGELGVPVRSLSLHQPGERALSGEYRFNCVNTYDKRDMAGLEYLSDSNTVWREDPIEAFRARRHPRLQLLVHPEWWTSHAMPVQAKWRRMLRNNFELMQTSLLERERAYEGRLAISFRRAPGKGKRMR